MTPGKSLLTCAVVLLFLSLAACSSSTSKQDNTISSASQDLTLDPDGQTTVITFLTPLPAGVVAANFESSGTQTATGVTVVGNVATVTWDDRVTPSHSVRPVGISGSSSTFRVVKTTNAAAPVFTATGVQTVGASLGLDSITVTFTGPKVVEADVEDPANWRLQVGGTTLDLTGAVLTLNTMTQVLDFDLPTTANLHASFNLTALDVRSVADVAVAAAPVTGAATGDVTPPTLVGGMGVQNLVEDDFGMVVDFQFSEPMDPVFAPSAGNFASGFPVFAVSATQIAPDTLRVAFTGPVVPGADTVTLTGVVDAHGNAFAGGAVAVTAGSTVANGFAANPTLSTVQNVGGDTLVATFVQALDPNDAEDPAHWSLTVDGNPVTLSAQVLTHDFTAKTLTIGLTSDFRNGDAFVFQAAGANEPRDIDGELFTSMFAGAVAGETTLPTILSVTQNRSIDPTGRTLDVLLSEDVDVTLAQNVGNWSVAGGPTVNTAVLQGNLELVRLGLSSVAVPGAVTLGAANLEDLAGNALATIAGVVVGTTDSTPPIPSSQIARAVEGIDNDTLTVAFNDDMIAAEVIATANWTVQSPIGTNIDESVTAINYEPTTRTATMLFGATSPFFFKTGDDFSVTFNTMRDIGGNVVGSTVLTGTVTAESTLPLLESAVLDGSFANQVHVRFTEACDHLDDLFHATSNPTGLTQYVVKDSMGVVRGVPQTVAIHSDQRGATLTFGFVVAPGSDTLDVGGVTDLAGNALFPVALRAIGTETSGTPVLDLGGSEFSVTSGEENDTVTVAFDRPMSRFELLDPSHYTLELAAVPVDLTGATFTFDGDRTVTIGLDTPAAPNLQTAGSYDLTVAGLFSAEGIAIAGSSNGSITAAGGSDAANPTLPANSVRLDPLNPTTAVLIQMDEAIDPADAVNTALVTLAGVNPTTAEIVGPRTVRGTFMSAMIGQTLNVTFGDLAGNSALASLAVVAADTTPPLLTGATAIATIGLGGDQITVTYDEPVSSATALSAGNYAVTQSGNPVDLSGATLQLESGANLVRIRLASNVDLDVGLPFNLVVTNVRDTSGNLMSPAGNVSGAITGDMTPPGFAGSFVNFRENAAGTVVDLLFDEDVGATFAGTAANYTSSGGQTVLSAVVLRGDVVRLTLSSALVGGNQIAVTGLLDAARNASATITTTPTL